jgi:N6-adenosine-specific RNA methylase IME4
MQEVNVNDLRPHPRNVAIYGEDAIAELTEQIRTSNWIKPLVVNPANCRIISGHRRWRSYREFADETAEIEALLLENANREKTMEQKVREADVWHEIEAWKAKQRQLAAQNNNAAKAVPVNLPEQVKGDVRDLVAVKIGLSGKTYERAAKIVATADALKEHDKPQEAQALLDTLNTKSVSAAYRQIVAKSAETPTLPTGKYRVIYADPPWKYGNTMPDYFFEQADHYPLMTVREIADLPMRDIAEDNAVLFLWVTSPILAEAFDVIKSWGFTYKASFVWDKVKHNMGHYNSVRHEFLLICVRGSCQPDVQKLFDSVVSVERTEHSRKPAMFREMIDTIYPNGRRIELFAREHIQGWDVYGNQLPERQEQV